MVPLWLHLLATLYLVIGFASAVAVIYDIIIKKNRQKMFIMNIVWPVNAWFLGIVGYWFYRRIGRQSIQKPSQQKDLKYNVDKDMFSQPQNQEQKEKSNQQKMQEDHKRKPLSQKAFTGATHCATGCTLGDVMAEWIIFFGSLSIFGLTVFASFIFDYILAYTLGIIFQYFSIVPMRKMIKGEQLSIKEGLKASIRADTLSLTAYEVGLFVWMGLTQLVFFHPSLKPTEPTFWFMMQIGMALGLLTTYPANWWLVKKGFKYGM